MAEPIPNIGHLAFFYRPGEGALAARFFEALGCRVQNFGSILAMNDAASDDSAVYRVLMETMVSKPDEHAGYAYISPAQPQQLAFESRLSGLLARDDDPAYAAFRTFKASEPEMFFHAALRYGAFEELEAAALKIEALKASEPRLEGRISMLRFRPRSIADPEVNARIARSPAFAVDDRPSFGDRNIQVFIHTDLFAGELLALGQVIEIGYTFPPGYSAR